ncbi:Aminomethyltransferase folate-binding domain-containing protein [Aulographum hederae CBS 113979]|uniref:Iron-sulfur cluster assembly factor IBA57 homolog, mitochondrial n=1 Tax=Aulographum hederae CBS 113979 TaxID=1176131 RepID=A0A6G1HDP6_9PEZI|nr:Aminomethyltransferase folate-binding domain-containing protein [Aulographum hederae CBS 113979]
MYRSSYRPFVCSNCRRDLARVKRQWKPNNPRYSSSNSTIPHPPSSGLAKLTGRRLLSLSGVDAPKFLQGLTTNNVDPHKTRGWYTAFLNAQGRVLWDAFVYPVGWSREWKEWEGNQPEDAGYLIEVDSEELGSVMKHLKRHKLRSKVKIKPVEEGDWHVWSAWKEDVRSGQSGEDISGISRASEPLDDPPPSSTDPVILPDPRLSGFGDRLILLSKTSSPGSLSKYANIDETTSSSYTLRRYLHGIAEGQTEIIKEHALPMESNIDFMSGIDFRKGCYVGQELTIRTHHTGVIRKRILPVQLYGPEEPEPTSLQYKPDDMLSPPPPGSDIKKTQGRGRSAGKYLAGIGNIGLGLCRLEMMTDVKVTAEAGASSYQEGMEFQLAWERGAESESGESLGREETVKIKAFVPVWHKGKERVRGPQRRVE